MEVSSFDFKDVSRRMEGAIAALKSDLSGLRTGRASANLLDPIQVDAYGSKIPISQLATISVPEPRMVSVQVWDAGNAEAVDRAIRDSDLGLNPISEGAFLRIPIPELNEERRQEMVKVAHKYAERARVAVRHVRRDAMDQLKKKEKISEISKDELHSLSEKVQTMTDDAIKSLDDILHIKESEILQV